MQRRAPPHGDAVLIGVTIEASVPAGAVHADIHTRHTLAPGPLLRGTDIKAASGHPLDKLTAEATRVDDTGDIHVLHTQGKPYPPALRHRRKRGKQLLPSLPAVPAEPKSRYPAAELRVHIQKTDDTRARNAFKPFRQRIKTAHMPRKGIGPAEKDGIIPPDHPFAPKSFRQPLHSFDQFQLVRKPRLHIPPIPRQRKLEHTRPATQQPQPIQQRQRVLRPQNKAVHGFAGEHIPGDAARIMAHAYVARLQPIAKPLRVIGRNIRTTARAENHIFFLAVFPASPQRAFSCSPIRATLPQLEYITLEKT